MKQSLETTSKVSLPIKRYTIDKYILEALKHLYPKGAICDLGCGDGDRVISLCKELNVKGYGFDFSQKAIVSAIRQAKKHPEVSSCFIADDISDIKEEWPEVEVLIQTLTMLRLSLNKNYVKIFENYKRNFPNMKYFLVFDMIASKTHSALNELLKSSHYEFYQETTFPLSNSRLWIFKNKNFQDNCLR